MVSTAGQAITVVFLSFVFFISFFFGLPFLIYAQSDSQNQTVVACVQLTRSLYFGSSDALTGGQVTALQKFLAKDPTLYPEGRITGYFGALTQAAVQRYQARNGIVSSGSPLTTGYGAVGPKTRAAMALQCFGSVALSGSSSSSGVLRVISPNGGEVFSKETTAEIVWSGLPATTRVDIFAKTWFSPCTGDIMCGAVNALARTFTIASSAENSGKFAWTVGRDVNNNELANGYYKIIISNQQKTEIDTSDDFFAVASSSEAQNISYLTTAPREQNLKIGSVAGILWTSSFSITRVNIFLEQGGTAYQIAKNLPNEHALVWTVGKDINGNNVPSGAYIVNIKDANSALSGKSTNAITIN